MLVNAGLAILLRLRGKRDLAQLNSFDLVVMLLLANVVQNAVATTLVHNGRPIPKAPHRLGLRRAGGGDAVTVAMSVAARDGRAANGTGATV